MTPIDCFKQSRLALDNFAILHPIASADPLLNLAREYLADGIEQLDAVNRGDQQRSANPKGTPQ